MQIPFIVKHLGRVDYENTWLKMKAFTEERNSDTPDEFWVLEHNPVFTLGLAGKAGHMLNKEHNIPLISTDRGGQITYHGPGQIVIYTLVDLQRAHLSVRQLVERLEQGMIAYLQTLGVTAYGDREAPGVYIEGKKIASMGLKVRKNATYHGISFNVAMDTVPFNYINVCGYAGLKVVQLTDLLPIDNLQLVESGLVAALTHAIYAPHLQLSCSSVHCVDV